MSAPSARTAKYLAEDLAELKFIYGKHGVDIMVKVLECNAKSCPTFNCAILSSQLVAATLDQFWSAGITPI